MPSQGWAIYKRGVAHLNGPLFRPPQRVSQRGRISRRCGPWHTRNAAPDAGQHGFPACAAAKRGEAAPRASPLPRAAAAWRTGRGADGGSDPLIFGAGAPPGRDKWPTLKPTIYPPLRGVAPSTVIPGGKAIERLFALTVDECVSVLRCVLIVALCVVVRLNIAPCTASYPRLSRNPSTAPALPHPVAPQRRRLAARPRRPGPRRTQDHRWPKRREGQARSMLTTGHLRSEAGAACHPARRSRRKSLQGRTIARIGPPTSHMVQWIPVQLEGLNRGMEPA